MFDWLFRRHLEDDESVIRLVHRHWLVGFKELFWPILSLCALLVFIVAVLQGGGYLLVIAGVLLAATAVWLLRAFFDYYLDAWIITDKGIIDVAWHGWFHRESSRILYSDIQGVSYSIQGIFETLLQYGTISVEKMSTGTSIAMPQVRHPRNVEGLILQNMEAYLHKKNLKDSKTVQEMLATVIAREIQSKDVQTVRRNRS